jgi:hypothetical protein
MFHGQESMPVLAISHATLLNFAETFFEPLRQNGVI